mgnify:CR=1 FL=1
MLLFDGFFFKTWSAVKEMNTKLLLTPQPQYTMTMMTFIHVIHDHHNYGDHDRDKPAINGLLCSKITPNK